MYTEIIPMIISFASMLISALTFGFVFFQTTKNWYVNIVTTERLAWAKNVRKELAAYIEAYYNLEDEDLRPYENRILLYLNSECTNANPEHKKFVESLKAVTNHQVQDLDTLMIASQSLMNWNWRETKKESSTILRSKNVPK